MTGTCSMCMKPATYNFEVSPRGHMINDKWVDYDTNVIDFKGLYCTRHFRERLQQVLGLLQEKIKMQGGEEER